MSDTSRILTEFSSMKVVVIIFIALTSFLLSLLFINSTILPHDGIKSYTRQKSADTTLLVFTPAEDTETKEHPLDLIPHGSSVKVIILKKSELTFNQNPTLLLWMILFSIMFAVGMALSIPFVGIATLVIKDFEISRKSVYINFALVVVITLAIVITTRGKTSFNLLSAFGIITKFEILLSDTTGLVVMMRLVVVSGSVALFGILMINTALGILMSNKSVNQADLFLTLKESIAELLSSISIIIMLAVVTTALLQQAIESVLHIESFLIFPSELVYTYGLMFTIFLAMLYIPVHYRLKSIELKIFEKTGSGALEPVHLKDSTIKGLKPILSIFAPLLGSVFSELLKNISI